MITLDDYIFMLWRKGIVNGEVVLERAQNREEMRKNMMGEGITGAKGDATADLKMAAMGGAAADGPVEEY
jgi:hypothetical protein